MFVFVLQILGRTPARMAPPTGKHYVASAWRNGIGGDVVRAVPVQLNVSIGVAYGTVAIPIITPPSLRFVWLKVGLIGSNDHPLLQRAGRLGGRCLRCPGRI